MTADPREDTPSPNAQPESPTVIAARLGLGRSNAGNGGKLWSWDELVDAAVEAYVAKAHKAGRPIVLDEPRRAA